MGIAVRLAMIFVLRWFYLPPGQTEDDVSVSTCNVSTCIAPAAELTTEATVTCLFPVDIKERKLGFRVHHYEHYLSESVAVVTCTWMSGELDCLVESGYKEGNSTLESFTLRIPHFLPNHTGGYLCDLDDHYNESCTLHQLPSAQLSMTPVSPLVADTTGSQGFIIVSAVVAPATVIIIIVVAVTQYRLRRKRHLNSSRTPGHDKNDITITDQREELVDQRQECESDNKLPPMRSMVTTSCKTCNGRLTTCEEQGQQTPLSSTNEVSSTSQTRLSKQADVISAVTALCTGVVKQNAATKLCCQLDADGSVTLVCESGFLSPQGIPEQEPVSLGLLQIRSEAPCQTLAVDEYQQQTSLSPDKTCSVDDKESEGKTSIAVQEEVTANVHMRNFDPNTYEHPHEGDRISLKQTCKLEMLLVSDDNSRTKPSPPLYSC